MTLKEFFAEISTTFASYQETGDIDFVSVKMWVTSCLRQFGKNICEQNEAIIDVKNSQATLPENFKSLILALELASEGYNILGDREKAKDSFIYRERIEQPGYYDWVTRQFIPNCQDGKLITESIVMNEQAAEFYYKPTYLSVVKGFNKESFDVDCLNLHPSIRNAYPNMISINKNTLQTSFKEGKLYIQFNSLPMEDGEISIPEISTGDILLYIENYVKIRIAENLILNAKNPNSGLQSLLQMWLAQNRQLFLAAKSESNWLGLGNFSKNYNRKLQVDFNKYSLPSF